MQHIVDLLKINICNPLPGLAVQMQMAPPVRTPMQKAPANAKIGAVVILVYPKHKQAHVLLMRRTIDYGVHSGQISLPGGRQDANDFSTTHTAMRELQEEMGVDISKIRILGNLTPLYIPPSNFVVTPIVCYASESLKFIKSDAEVKEIIELPLATLLQASTKQTGNVFRSDDNTKDMEAPLYYISETIRIWGATAMMLREFEELMLQIVN